MNRLLGRLVEMMVHLAEEDLEALRVGSARVPELRSERSSLTTGTKKAKAERDTFAARMHKFEVAAVAPHRELGIFGAGCTVFGSSSGRGQRPGKYCEGWYLGDGGQDVRA